MSGWAKIYRIFTVPKPNHQRLLDNMRTMNIHCDNWEQPAMPVVFGVEKESKLKLSVEARNEREVIIVRCEGRIVYRDEAAALSRVVGEFLHPGSKLVLDLSGVTSMDSAGIGELALLQTWAQERDAELKCAGPNDLVSTLLELTNLESVLDVHASVEEAMEAFHTRLCAD
jgi:anti-sigma B factor antagonist